MGLRYAISLALLLGLVVGVTDPGDEAALVQFFDLWEFALDKSGWESLSDPCGNAWPGVTCNGANRVTEVDVTFNNIGGRMHESFCDLTELVSLNLTGNRLEALPACLGQSPQDSMTNIGLARNDLLFQPFPDFTQCTGLVTLDLGNNGLLGPIPAAYGSMTALLDFRLNDNVINGGLIDFAAASPLVTLIADSAGLTGTVPTTLVTNTPALTTLRLHGNSFTGAIPAGIVGQTVWTELTLYSNSFDCPLPNVTHLLGGGKTDCICGPGTFTADPIESCGPCPAGTYSTRDVLSGETCVACPQGTYNAFNGSDTKACLPCPPGKGSDLLGATGEGQCVTCTAGTWGPGASACIPCGPGTTSVDGADSPCTDCPADTFAPNTTGVCYECPGAPSGSATCEPGIPIEMAAWGIGGAVLVSGTVVGVVQLTRNKKEVLAWLTPA